MAKKTRKKLPELEQIKKKIQGKVYVGDEMKKREIKIKELENLNDQLENQLDSLQAENYSLKQVIKIRVK